MKKGRQIFGKEESAQPEKILATAMNQTVNERNQKYIPRFDKSRMSQTTHVELPPLPKLSCGVGSRT